MMPRQEHTIAGPVELTGTGLFSGKECTVRIHPAEPSTGILFSRIDLPDSPVIPAETAFVGEGFNCTVLRHNDVEVRSVEHVLSSCMALEVDNLLIEVDCDEMPAAGGCAHEYAELFMEAGFVEQGVEKKVFCLNKPVAVSEGNASIVGTPGEEDGSEEKGLVLNYVLDFNHKEGIGAQVATFRINAETFINELAPARTWALEDAYGEFEKRGLGSGVTDTNALVLFNDGSFRNPLSKEEVTPRFSNECARHKLADLLGDLALTGVDIRGNITAVRSGHRLNAVFAARIRRIIEQEKEPEKYLDIREIRKILPHRYPFLMVDRIVGMKDENRVRGVKNVSINEHFFQGHYPDYPVMPGVLQLESLAQVAGVLLLKKLEHAGKVALMVAMDGVKLRRPVQPGDQMVLEAEVIRVRSRSALVKAQGRVEGQIACEAEMKFMLVDREVL